MPEAEPKTEPHDASLASVHSGKAPAQDDSLPSVAWPTAAATLLVWHACALLAALARWVVSTVAVTMDARGTEKAARLTFLPGETPRALLEAIGRAVAEAPMLHGERTVQSSGRMFKVPVHLAVVVPAQEAKLALMQSYVEAAASAGVRRVSWFDPYGVVQRAFPAPTQLHIGEAMASLAPHRFPTAEGRIQVALLSSEDGKAALAQLAPHLTPPITAHHVDETVTRNLSPPQVILLPSAPHDKAASVALAQLPDYPPWGIGLSELVPLPASLDAETGVLTALHQLAGADQRFGR